MKRLLLVALAGIGPALVAHGGCSDAPAAAPVDGDAGPPDAPREGSRSDSDVPPPDADSGPTYDENGWLRVDFDPDYDCRFYSAPSPEKMPPPIVWEPCIAPLPAGLDCQHMKAEWQAPDTGAFGFTRSGYVDPAGHVLLGIHRTFASRYYDLVAEADGPVHHAMAAPAEGNCYIGEASVREGHVTYLASRQTPSLEFPRWGAVGGGIDDVARVLASYPNQGSGGGRGYFAGGTAFFEYGAGGPTVRDWSGAVVEKLAVNAPGQFGRSMFQQDALLLSVRNLTYGRVMVWTPTTGVQDLISYGNDVSHYASDAGTDGVDLVWVEATGRTESGTPFAKYDLMAAPYATKQSEVQKRRVSSADEGGLGTAPNIVGCGYAARTAISPGKDGLRITRLSDGRTWRLLDDATHHWQAPVAITCNEVFIGTTNAIGGRFVPNLARVRLDSLGPGDPAD